MFDAQRYTLNLYLINNVEDEVVFMKRVLILTFSFIVIETEIHVISRNTKIDNNQFWMKKRWISHACLIIQNFYVYRCQLGMLSYEWKVSWNYVFSPFILSFTTLQIFLYFLILTLQTVALLQCLYLTIFSKNSCSLPGKRKWQNMASLRIFSCMHILREGSLHIWEGGGRLAQWVNMSLDLTESVLIFFFAAWVYLLCVYG